MDTFEHYRKQIAHALQELAGWGEKKKEAEQQMAKLRQLIAANANMLPDVERDLVVQQAETLVVSGFTDTIRQIFATRAPNALTPVMVRDALVNAGVDLSSQSNAMASIHSVIRRLVESGEIEHYGAGDLSAYRAKNIAANPILRLRRRPNAAFYGELDPDKVPDDIRPVAGRLPVDFRKKK